MMDEAGDDFEDFLDEVDDFLDAGFFLFFSTDVVFGAGICTVSVSGFVTTSGIISGNDSTHTCAGD